MTDGGASLLLPWGKWNSLTAPMPLLAHLLDTAGVALELWPGLSERTRQRLCELLTSNGDEVLAGARFAYLAAVHDLGKCEGMFQGQRWSRHSGDFDTHVGALEAAGFSVGAKVAGGWPVEAPFYRHEALTSYLLAEHRSGLPAWARLIVAGHHGRYQKCTPQGNRELDKFHRAAKAGPWFSVQQDLLDAVEQAITDGSGAHALSAEWPGITPRLVPFLPVVTGLVSVCDWIASDERFVRGWSRYPISDPGRYLQYRRSEAAKKVYDIWGQPGIPSGSFPELFDQKTPRGAAQNWAVRNTATSGAPGLTIVMVPMGEGKTEVALWRHIKGAASGEGLYFGLPTMATADAMFDRVREVWKGTPTAGHLAHSKAILNEFYAPTNLNPTWVCDEESDHVDSGLRPSDWFSGSHRGLLSPITVGTCDQVLAAALNHKYLTVRLAGLAGKHLVLDEVHTYDPYQHELLRRLLGWLGTYRTRVTLLSATLPTERLRELVAAWTGGWDEPGQERDKWRSASEDLSNVEYPGVVTVNDQTTQVPLDAWRSFTLGIKTHNVNPSQDAYLDSATCVVRRLRREAPVARIGVIVNTVDRAIGLYEKLRGGEQGRSVLLHSRMPGKQRSERTKALHAAVGEKACAGPALVVATQIAEASLDLDFDILVSDLAPMASLLQRSGRLWRHSTISNGVWSHPTHLFYRSGNPVLHVLVPSDAQGDLDMGFSLLPYSPAEMSRTFTDPACLDGGRRFELMIPGDVQAAVDAANVSFATLAEAVDGPDALFLAHLGAKVAKQMQAADTGTNVGAVAIPWRNERSAEWAHKLTYPTLWSDTDGAVTRLSSSVQYQFLVWEQGTENPYVYAEDPAHLMTGPAYHRTAPGRQQVLEALDCVVPVSGRLATRLFEAGKASLPKDWARQAPAILRGVVPLPLAALSGIAYMDPELGLVRIKEIA